MTGMTKSFPGVRALDDAQLELEVGEVHVLLGENGAGKSTLMKVLCGQYQPDGGTMELDGVPIAPQFRERNLGFIFFPEAHLPGWVGGPILWAKVAIGSKPPMSPE